MNNLDFFIIIFDYVKFKLRLGLLVIVLIMYNCYVCELLVVFIDLLKKLNYIEGILSLIFILDNVYSL